MNYTYIVCVCVCLCETVFYDYTFRTSSFCCENLWTFIRPLLYNNRRDVYDVTVS